MSRILLRDVWESDLPIFFDHQMDREANRMAAFTRKDPDNWDLFSAHWAKILADETIINQTIIVEHRVVGHVLCFEQFGEKEISYWIERNQWGKGIATQALLEFLNQIPTRPLHARAAKDNIGSLKVLEKCGFRISGESSGFSNARGEEVEEFVLILTV